MLIGKNFSYKFSKVVLLRQKMSLCVLERVGGSHNYSRKLHNHTVNFA
ncbi:hypothetical protein FBHYGVHD_CDS0003 [Staphylococcus phage MVC_VPHSA1]|uniref:Uncharacterized protein n=1 Tax=Staphylococcus phage MVC_VPHSA1 TaxID=3088876 RepID=A0ABZ0QYB8_9CAUD|nr:hypothetical protein FBHYGVHD_CDS0003 [Staphylococcus phage MVC_VPHSA1]